VELIVQPAAKDAVGEMAVRGDLPSGRIEMCDLVGQFRIHERGVIPLKRKEALGWAESKALDFDKVEEMFGKVAEAGDQTGAPPYFISSALRGAKDRGEYSKC